MKLVKDSDLDKSLASFMRSTNDLAGVCSYGGVKFDVSLVTKIHRYLVGEGRQDSEYLRGLVGLTAGMGLTDNRNRGAIVTRLQLQHVMVAIEEDMSYLQEGDLFLGWGVTLEMLREVRMLSMCATVESPKIGTRTLGRLTVTGDRPVTGSKRLSNVLSWILAEGAEGDEGYILKGGVFRYEWLTWLVDERVGLIPVNPFACSPMENLPLGTVILKPTIVLPVTATVDYELENTSSMLLRPFPAQNHYVLNDMGVCSESDNSSIHRSYENVLYEDLHGRQVRSLGNLMVPWGVDRPHLGPAIALKYYVGERAGTILLTYRPEKVRWAGGAKLTVETWIGVIVNPRGGMLIMLKHEPSKLLYQMKVVEEALVAILPLFDDPRRFVYLRFLWKMTPAACVKTPGPHEPFGQGIWQSWEVPLNARFDGIRGLNRTPLGFAQPVPWFPLSHTALLVMVAYAHLELLLVMTVMSYPLDIFFQIVQWMRDTPSLKTVEYLSGLQKKDHMILIPRPLATVLQVERAEGNGYRAEYKDSYCYDLPNVGKTLVYANADMTEIGEVEWKFDTIQRLFYRKSEGGQKILRTFSGRLVYQQDVKMQLKTDSVEVGDFSPAAIYRDREQMMADGNVVQESDFKRWEMSDAIMEQYNVEAFARGHLEENDEFKDRYQELVSRIKEVTHERNGYYYYSSSPINKTEIVVNGTIPFFTDFCVDDTLNRFVVERQKTGLNMVEAYLEGLSWELGTEQLKDLRSDRMTDED